METNQPAIKTYFAIRMATGSKVHLREDGSSQTLCSTWVGYSRQYKTDESVVTCTKCWRAANARIDRAADVASLGFTNEEVK